MAKADFSIVKIALEHASFVDFRIRDGINLFLKSAEADLDEVGVEFGLNTNETIKNLEEIIDEVETPLKLERERVRIESEGDDEGVVEVDDKSEVEFKSHKVVNVDEELNEFGG